MILSNVTIDDLKSLKINNSSAYNDYYPNPNNLDFILKIENKIEYENKNFYTFSKRIPIRQLIKNNNCKFITKKNINLEVDYIVVPSLSKFIIGKLKTKDIFHAYYIKEVLDIINIFETIRLNPNAKVIYDNQIILDSKKELNEEEFNKLYKLISSEKKDIVDLGINLLSEYSIKTLNEKLYFAGLLGSIKIYNFKNPKWLKNNKKSIQIEFPRLLK